MHPAARAYVARVASRITPGRVVEIGSRNINGQVRDLFPWAVYTGTDLVLGPGVDVLADGATYVPPAPPDCVVCCEVLEHAANWPAIVANAGLMLAPGGWLIVTCAGPARAPHSAVDGAALRPGEHYENLTLEALRAVAAGAGLTARNLTDTGDDVYGWFEKGSTPLDADTSAAGH